MRDGQKWILSPPCSPSQYCSQPNLITFFIQPPLLGKPTVKWYSFCAKMWDVTFVFVFFFFSCQKVLSALHWTKHTLEYLLPTLTMPFMDLILQLETKIQVWFLSHIHSWLYVVWVFTCIQEGMHVYRSFSGVCVFYELFHMPYLELWFSYLCFDLLIYNLLISFKSLHVKEVIEMMDLKYKLTIIV